MLKKISKPEIIFFVLEIQKSKSSFTFIDYF